MTRPPLRRAALAAAALAALLFAGGAVYLRLAGADAPLRAAGGREVFRDEASVNGLAGTVRVFAMPAAAAGRAPSFGPAGAGAWIARVPGQAPGAPGAAVLFEAPGAGRAAGGPAAPAWPVAGVPAPAGLETSFAATLGGGAAAAAAGTTADPPAAAAARLRAALRAGGWTPATPGADGATSFFFRRGGAVAFGSAVPRAAGGTGWLLLRSDRALP